MNLTVVKLGSQVITDAGAIQTAVLGALAEDIAYLRRSGEAVLLVSSGAVAAGRTEVSSLPVGTDEVAQRQLFSAMGQVLLMQAWRAAFADVGMQCAQVLATRSDFRDRDHYVNMQRCLQALLRADLVPVVNENDVVSVTELMFTDNDELAGLIAGMLGAQRLILLSNVDGVLGTDSKPISVWTEQTCLSVEATMGKSKFGRGGMHTKIRVARDAAGAGVECFIAQGREPGVVRKIIEGEALGTRFPASSLTSAQKRWLQASAGHEKGHVVVNAGAAEVLRNPDALASLLPVGIAAVKGEFDRGDIVRIDDEGGATVGYGRAQYSAERARQLAGQREQKPLVHYDYLVIKGSDK